MDLGPLSNELYVRLVNEFNINCSGAESIPWLICPHFGQIELPIANPFDEIKTLSAFISNYQSYRHFYSNCLQLSEIKTITGYLGFIDILVAMNKRVFC